MPADVEAIETQ